MKNVQSIDEKAQQQQSMGNRINVQNIDILEYQYSHEGHN
jgi:hypothetical protein